jgi:hypothetical protein
LKEKKTKNEEWGYEEKRKNFSTLPSPMSTRCQYVEREKRGNLSTHADQYHSSIVLVALLSFFLHMCHWTELNFNDSWLCDMSTTNYIDLYQIIIIIITIIIIIKNNNDDDDDTTFLYSPVIVCTFKYVYICKRVR